MKWTHILNMRRYRCAKRVWYCSRDGMQVPTASFEKVVYFQRKKMYGYNNVPATNIIRKHTRPLASHGIAMEPLHTDCSTERDCGQLNPAEGVSEGNSDLVDDTTSSTTQRRHNIPVQFKRMSLSRARRNADGGRVCSRVAMYGTGSIQAVQKLMAVLQTVLGCKYYGGFSRNGVWEALLSFNKNSCERPYEEEIERCLDYFYGEGSISIDVLDTTLTRSVIAFVYRLRCLSDKFGTFPAYMNERVRQYEKETASREAEAVVQDVTGMQFNAQNMVFLFNSLQTTTTQMQEYRAQVHRYRTMMLTAGLLPPGAPANSRGFCPADAALSSALPSSSSPRAPSQLSSTVASLLSPTEQPAETTLPSLSTGQAQNLMHQPVTMVVQAVAPR